MERQTILRRFKSNSKSRAKVRRSPSIIAAISENRGSPAKYLSDMSKAKRVKFSHSDPNQSPRSDAPKTSEYAFFKKLKEDIGGCHSRPLDKDSNKLMTAKANDGKSASYSFSERSTPCNIFKYADRNLRTSLQAEKERPIGQFSFLSPPIRVKSNNVWRLTSKDEYTRIKQRSSFPSDNLTPDGKNLVLSPFASLSNSSGMRNDQRAKFGPNEISGNQYAGKGIFSVKRKKLRQLVADTLPGVGECSSKGFDLVPALLSRLFPKGKENECCPFSNSEEGVLDAAYSSAALPESDNEEKIRTRKTEFKYGSCWNDNFREYWSGSPRERAISKCDITTANFPLTKYDAEFDFHDEEAISNCGLDGKAIKNLFTERESSCYLTFDNYRTSSSGHLNELVGYRNPSESARREPHTLLLSWDINEKKDQKCYPALATSPDVAYQQILKDGLHAFTMRTSSLCSNFFVDSLSKPYFHSSGACSHYLGRNYADHYAVVEANQFPSFTPKYLTMAEDYENLLEKNNVSLYCKDQPLCTSKDSGWKGHLEALLLSKEINDDLEWRRLPLSEFSEDYSSNCHIFQFPFKEDVYSFALPQDEGRSLYRPKSRETSLAFSAGTFDIHNWFSASLHISLDKLLGHPLLLDNSGRVRSEEEMYFDDGDQWKSS